MVETTALGAAKLAALGVGLPPVDAGRSTGRMRVFTPAMADGSRTELRERWAIAIARAWRSPSPTKVRRRRARQ